MLLIDWIDEKNETIWLTQQQIADLWNSTAGNYQAFSEYFQVRGIG